MNQRLRPFAFVVCWALLAGIGCSGMQIRPHVSDTGPVFGAARPTLGEVDTGRVSSGTSSATVQTICRTAGVPRAWVAVDYVEVESCPASKGERFTGALLVRHSVYNKGSELLVCANQRVPNGWRRAGAVTDPTLTYLCQSSLTDKPVEDRVMRIYKP